MAGFWDKFRQAVYPQKKILSPFPSKQVTSTPQQRPNPLSSLAEFGKSIAQPAKRSVSEFGRRITQPVTVASGSFDRPTQAASPTPTAPTPPPPTPAQKFTGMVKGSGGQYDDLLNKVFGGQAPQFRSMLSWGDSSTGGKWGVDYGGENLGFNPRAENKNKNGTLDRGLFQINSDTFAKLQANETWGPVVRASGINSFDDMFDPELNAKMALIIWKERESWDPKGGFAAWYGASPGLLYNEEQ